MRVLFVLGFALSALGCVASPRGAAKAQEAAVDLNTNARFGRMEIASERVAPKGREDFFSHRRGWGGQVRIADTELAGVHLTGDDDADVMVRVAWYRLDEEELHVTTLRQKWHVFGVEGDWKLIAEIRADGEGGLIGEQSTSTTDPNAPRTTNARFPTVHITGAGLSPQ